MRTGKDFLAAHRSLLSTFSFPFSVFRFHLSVFWILHCAAVQASVLGEQDAAIYADDFAVGKGCL
jgi:hypothetical protein